MDIFTGSFAAFLGVSVLVIVTPGPDTALTIRNTVLGGRMGGVCTAAGVAVGQCIWALATSAGLLALLLASESMFLAVKLAGAAYLIALGGQSLWLALRGRDMNGVPAAAAGSASRLPPGRALRQGVISNLGNPKMAAFFTGLLPQFTPGTEAAVLPLPVLGVVFCAMTFAWLAAYALAVARLGKRLRGDRIRRTMEGITGTVLVGLGIRLAVENR